MNHHRTMDDFARACGISRSTLSKYFENAQSVRLSTRRRIEEALALSDYRPNLFARNMNRKRTRSVGILVPTILDPFYTELISLLELSLRHDGFWPISMSSHGLAEMEVEAIQMMLTLKVAGAIVAPLGSISDRAAFKRLAEAAPVVYFDGKIDVEAPFVGNDNHRSVAVMVEYICRTGDVPVYFDVPHLGRNAEERADSYRATMNRLGHEAFIVDGGSDYTWEFERLGYERMDKLLARGELPGRTILCANDRLAFGVMAAATTHGLTIGRRAGRDLRVAAHDDHPLSRFSSPSLTTMAQDCEGMAQSSVELLMSMLSEDHDRVPPGDRTPVRKLLAASLVMRESG